MITAAKTVVPDILPEPKQSELPGKVNKSSDEFGKVLAERRRDLKIRQSINPEITGKDARNTQRKHQNSQTDSTIESKPKSKTNGQPVLRNETTEHAGTDQKKVKSKGNSKIKPKNVADKNPAKSLSHKKKNNNKIKQEIKVSEATGIVTANINPQITKVRKNGNKGLNRLTETDPVKLKNLDNQLLKTIGTNLATGKKNNVKKLAKTTNSKPDLQAVKPEAMSVTTKKGQNVKDGVRSGNFTPNVEPVKTANKNLAVETKGNVKDAAKILNSKTNTKAVKQVDTILTENKEKNVKELPKTGNLKSNKNVILNTGKTSSNNPDTQKADGVELSAARNKTKPGLKPDGNKEIARTDKASNDLSESIKPKTGNIKTAPAQKSDELPLRKDGPLNEPSVVNNPKQIKLDLKIQRQEVLGAPVMVAAKSEKSEGKIQPSVGKPVSSQKIKSTQSNLKAGEKVVPEKKEIGFWRILKNKLQIRLKSESASIVTKDVEIPNLKNQVSEYTSGIRVAVKQLTRNFLGFLRKEVPTTPAIKVTSKWGNTKSLKNIKQHPKTPVKQSTPVVDSKEVQSGKVQEPNGKFVESELSNKPSGQSNSQSEQLNNVEKTLTRIAETHKGMNPAGFKARVNQVAMIQKISHIIESTAAGHTSNARVVLRDSSGNNLSINWDANHDKQITIVVESESTKSLVEKLLPNIQKTLEDKGVVLESLDVKLNNSKLSEKEQNSFNHENEKDLNAKTADQEQADIDPQMIHKDMGYNTMEVIA